MHFQPHSTHQPPTGTIHTHSIGEIAEVKVRVWSVEGEQYLIIHPGCSFDRFLVAKLVQSLPKQTGFQKDNRFLSKIASKRKNGEAFQRLTLKFYSELSEVFVLPTQPLTGFFFMVIFTSMSPFSSSFWCWVASCMWRAMVSPTNLDHGIIGTWARCTKIPKQLDADQTAFNTKQQN